MLSPRTLIRTKRFWFAVAILVAYTLFGFLIAPRIVSKQILANIATQLGRQATIRDVDLNPWTLSARLEGFQLLDPDNEAFVTFEDLFVDFQLSSLFRRAFTFKIVRLTSPRIFMRLMPNERSNFQDIVDRLAARPARPPDSTPKKPPRLLLQRLEIRDMRLEGSNLARPDPEVIEFTPVDLTLEKFTTIPRRDGTLSLAATGQGGGKWEWTGTATFEPLHSEGTFAITGEKLPEIWNVIRHRVGWEIASGVLSLRLPYRVDVRSDSVIAAITSGSLALDRFGFCAKDREPELLGLDSLRVGGVDLHFPKQTVSVKRIGISGVRATAWLGKSGKVNWLALLEPPVMTPSGVAKPGAVSSVTKPPPVWHLQMDEIVLSGGTGHFTDSTVTPPFAVDVAPVDVVLRNVTSERGASFELDAKAGIASKGTLTLLGQAVASPPALNAQLRLAALPLALFQPYVSVTTKLDIVTGDVGAEGRLVARLVEGDSVPDVHFEGSVASSDFLSQDVGRHERFLAWKYLRLQRVDAGKDKVHITAVDVVEPYGRIIVFENRRTNIDDVFMIPPRDTTATAPPAPPQAPMAVPVQIDAVHFGRGTADFADLSLILPFAAGIVELNGDVRGLSSDQLSRADVELAGGVTPAGAVRVFGQINPLSGDLYTDLNVQFQNFDLSALSPYSGQFLGRKIDQGKLKLDLQYQVAKRELIGQNKVVMDQFNLGESVESPDATSLPVGLAIALLKDRNGVIDLDLPVKGNLNDPKFRIWDAVWDVLRNLVVKLVTAPFSLLGRLVGWGGDGEEMSRIYFAPGRSELDAPEQEKLAKLATALAERPQLRLEVRGSSNPDMDAQAMREAKFIALADERSRRDPKKYPPALGGAGYAPRLFRDLYEEQFGRDTLSGLEQRFQVPKLDRDGKPDPKKTVLDAAGFYAEARKSLTEAQPVDPSELRAMALERSMTVKKLLLQPGGVEETRIFLLEVEENAKLADGRIQMELQLGH